MNTASPVTIGTVSHGTLRPQDLVKAFSDALATLIPTHDFVREAENIAHLETLGWTILDSNPDAASELINSLADALNGLCPEGVYFGAIEGDGSDFGFWHCAENETLD